MTSRLVACGGVDSSGAAGLDADREMAAELGAELHAVVTCYTDQDDTGLRSVEVVEAWSEALPAGDALKFGLLPRAADLRTAADLVRAARVPVVVDPVLASSSGYRFHDAPALEVFRGELIAAAPLLTPNRPEAQALTGLAHPELAARRLLELGASAVVVKGGHGGEDPVRDLVLAPGADPVWLEHPRVPRALRGTGCRFATALAVLLGRGSGLVDAAREAGQRVAARIVELGR